MEGCLVAIYCIQKRAVSNLNVHNVIFPGLWELQPVHYVVHFGAGRSERGSECVSGGGGGGGHDGNDTVGWLA